MTAEERKNETRELVALLSRLDEKKLALFMEYLKCVQNGDRKRADEIAAPYLNAKEGK